MSKRYSFGVILAAQDPRNYFVTAPRAADYPHELKVDMPTAYDQGDVGQCAMFALAIGPHKKYGKRFGTTMGYGRWRSHDLPGMDTNECNTGFAKEGLPLLQDDPVLLEVPEAMEYSAIHAEELLPKMGKYKGWTYYQLDTQDKVKAALVRASKEKGVNVVCTIRVSMYQPDRDNIWWNNDRTIGYHRVTLAGYEQVADGSVRGTNEYVICHNSWGTEWGVSGNCYLPWEQVFEMNDITMWVPPVTAPVDPEPKPEPIEPDDIVERRTLRKGMSGADVMWLQAQLIRLGYDLGKWGADGDFGSATMAAVEAFQRMHALTVDGICGPKTWAVIDAGAEWEEPGTGIKRRFLTHLRGAVGQLYTWSGNGQLMTEKLIRKMETSSRNADRVIALFRALVRAGKDPILGYDCSGLISRFLQDEGIVDRKRNSRHLYGMCDGFSDRKNLELFDLVFRYSGSTFKQSKIYHVGVYIGNGMVIEAQGRDAGVVERSIDASSKGYWNYYGRLKCMED